MRTDWQTPYRQALLEKDPGRVHEACERARRAINNRELARKSSDAPERKELEEALRKLMVHELKIIPLTAR